MGYSKQNFTAGSVLTASQMNKIDSGLYDVDDGITATIIASGTILSNIVSYPKKTAFFIANSYVPNDYPAQASSSVGYIEVMTQQDELKTIVIWHTFSALETYIRFIYNGKWQNEWTDVLGQYAKTGDIQKINNSLTVQTGDITTTASGTIIQQSCFKYGQVVNLSFTFHTISAISDGTVIAILPTGFYPKQPQSLIGCAAGYMEINDIEITTDGKITVPTNHGTIKAGRYFILQCSYICA